MSESAALNEVEFSTSAITVVDEAVIERVRRAAYVSPRKRARLCLHPHLGDALHNMLIVLLRDTVVPMHRHPHKPECYHIVSGLLTLVMGDDAGRDSERIPLGPTGSGRAAMCRIAPGLWHRVEVETDEVVMHESSVGPFHPSGTETLNADGTISAPRPRHALIVGGSRGIGHVLATRWAAEGTMVSILSRTPGASSAAAPNWRHFSADVRSKTALQTAVSQLLSERGCPDDVIFCQRWRGEGDAWDAELATTLSGTETILAALASHWSPDRSPSVVVVGSLAARQIAPEQELAYHVAKAGIEQMMRFFAAKWGPQGVRLNAVVPGIVMKESSKTFYAERPELLAAYQQLIPLQRLARPEDVCDAIDFLCSPRASYITGQTVVVDGGLSLAMPHAAVRMQVDHSHP